MEYTVHGLSRLAGVSGRTLRFYDSIGLLRPARVNASGYRVYGPEEVDRLQQVLFFKAFGLPLADIARAMDAEPFDRLRALHGHLDALLQKREQIDTLIDNVKKTILKEEGKIDMSDHEKFEGLKKRLVDENEQTYGAEARAKYGDDSVDASNRKMMNLTEKEYADMGQTSEQLQSLLAGAVRAGDSAQGEQGRLAAQLHKRWLSYTWPQYSVEAHLGLTQMYLDDARFTAYYDKETPGCARFLRDAVHAWASAL